MGRSYLNHTCIDSSDTRSLMNKLAFIRDFIGEIREWERIGMKMKREGKIETQIDMGGLSSNQNYPFILGDEIYISSIP